MVEKAIGSRWNSPLNPRPKISGGVVDPDDVRVCMDFRKVNMKQKSLQYNMLLVSDNLVQMAGFELCSEIDLDSAFHQICIKEESQDCSTFTDPWDGMRYWQRHMF